MAGKVRILIVDDEPMILRELERGLGREGFDVTTGNTLEDCRRHLGEGTFDLLLLDQRLPDGDGTSAVADIAAGEAAPAILVMTGNATVGKAVEAVRNGAFDYVSKPFGVPDLLIRIRQAVERRSLERKLRVAGRRLPPEGESVPPSRAMQETAALAREYAGANAPVLLLGETGVGKDWLAGRIHGWSARADGEFLALDCAGLTAHLAAAELFGHERGAFTGAESEREGLLELADGGTLFLDEIGELARDTQATFLRALETHRFRRVGGRKERASDFRLIAATNRDLEKAIGHGDFRSDLFFRISTLTITIPPLRERREDVSWLVRHFVRNLAGRDLQVEDEVLERLSAYDWPGNVRELRNVVERGLILGRNERLRIDGATLGRAPNSERSGPRATNGFPSLAEVERRHIQAAMERTGGNKTAAARLLDLPLTTLKRRLKAIDRT